MMGYGELGILRSSTLLMNRFSIELIIYDDSWDETHRIPMVHATRCLPLVVVNAWSIGQTGHRARDARSMVQSHTKVSMQGVPADVSHEREWLVKMF